MGKIRSINTDGKYLPQTSLLDDLFDATETPAPTASPSTTPSTTPSSVSKSASNGLSTGAKAAIGIVVPIVAIVLIVGGLLWYFKLRRRPRTAPTEAVSAAAYAPERKRSYVHHDDVRGNKVNRLLGQDLQLDPPLLSNERFLKASTAELPASPIKPPSVKAPSMDDNTTVHEFPSSHELLTQKLAP
jgi:hypothetical protein